MAKRPERLAHHRWNGLRGTAFDSWNKARLTSLSFVLTCDSTPRYSFNLNFFLAGFRHNPV
jgi:hypothetical protein